ncbi:MAG: Smr/MutS family protein [Rhizobiales bacterium]|nr:Smr/MutS family protein [Hyphomicrobiales bacterium]
MIVDDDDHRRRSRGRRALSGDERELWGLVTRTVAPLRGRARKHTVAAPEENSEPASSLPKSKPKAKSKTAIVSPPSRPSAPKPAPPLAPLGRKLTKRVARGNATLDGRLDLHGMTQEQAHDALLRFIRNAQADGAKVVLIITGKGVRGSSADMSERGVLRRMVPQWLRLIEFRAYVVGFESAHVTHGGEGALYVRLRRGR